jgi:putative DNA primase/helicase
MTKRPAGRNLQRLAQQNQQRRQQTGSGSGSSGSPPPLSMLLPPPTNPMLVARELVARHWTEDAAPCLVHWSGLWWQYRGTHWTPVPDNVVRATLYRFCEDASYVTPDGWAPWLPTKRKIADLFEAFAAVVIVSGQYQQPCWLDDRSTGPIVSVRKGLLDLSSRQLHPHTPRYFGAVSVPFDYDPDAPAPEHWLKFLGQLWPKDAAALCTLSEWFGYTVAGYTNLHKILLMVGPTRGGKGVTARVLRQLIGDANCCSPTLTSLSGAFGLMPLIGKSLAIITDARFNGKNAHTVVERLLSISGEDALTIDRKFQQHWHGQLGARFFVISNELPQLPDASNALTGRFIVLPLESSWFGREDRNLEQRFVSELPGILNWALDELTRLLKNDSRFTQVKAADEMVQAMRDLSSPVSAFVRERCTLGVDEQIAVDDLYQAYRDWCADGEYPRTSKAVFGRDLRAAYPNLRKGRPRAGGNRIQVYSGVALKTEAQADGRLDV